MSAEVKVWLSSRKCKGKTTYHVRWIDTVRGKWRSRAVGTDSKRAERERVRMEDKLRQGTYKEIRPVAWAVFVEEHCRKIPGKSNREGTQHTLNEFGEMFGLAPKAVTFGVIEEYVARLREHIMLSTINQKLN